MRILASARGVKASKAPVTNTTDNPIGNLSIGGRLVGDLSFQSIPSKHTRTELNQQLIIAQLLVLKSADEIIRQGFISTR